MKIAKNSRFSSKEPPPVFQAAAPQLAKRPFGAALRYSTSMLLTASLPLRASVSVSNFTF